ncbi:DNA polymerase III subunit gamma/tau [Lutibacter sp. B2]|nr:DNA polymerase III subunit gamma/tau [Lutibacter sp. B2]
MAHIALYRKWRPETFEDVVGQGHITKTLKNQMKNDSIAHAYLFCGTRGTGKTSTAKIFARAVNCLNPHDGNPCNECEICSGIKHENMMDVMEIDAASNNGVDDIRELRENVKYPPTKGKYKVYIIDEVHMLSTGAFNALLKTLEEPPHYVIFILATTEPHKIPATILSRCQRFDFKRVKESEMVDRLAYICENMNIEVEKSGLELISRNSDGALRDALSILDQCLSFGAEKISYDDVIDVLGTVNDDFLFHLVSCILSQDTKSAMELIEQLIESGKDIHQFIKDLIEHYRNLMMTKISNQLEGIVNLSRESIERLKEQAEKINMHTITRAIAVLSQTSVDAKWTSQPRILLEVAVMKLSHPMLEQSADALMDRVQALEKIIQSGEIKVSREIESKEMNGEKKSIAMSKSAVEKIDHKEKVLPKGEIFEVLKKSWNEILKVIKKRKISLNAVLMEGEPVGMQDHTLIIAFNDGFEFHKEASAQGTEFIEKAIKEITGQKIKMRCLMRKEISSIQVSENESKENEETKEENKEVDKIETLFEDCNLKILD